MIYKDNPLMEPVFFTPPGSSRLYKGGGSSAPENYENLEALYGEQTAAARMLRQQAEAHLPGAVSGYMNLTNEYLDPAFRERQAGMASADAITANTMERVATQRNLASMGVNPNDPRFAGSLRSAEMGNAARLAGAQNAARNDARGMQLAVAKDAVGTFTGQSNMAAQQMGRATSGMANLANMQQQSYMNQQQQQSQNMANIVGGSMAVMDWFKDGGRVKSIEKHMLGGLAGSQQNTPMPQYKPPQQAPQRQMKLSDVVQKNRKLGEQMLGLRKDPVMGGDQMARAVGKFSPEAGANIGAQTSGMRMSGEQAGAARDAYMAAAQRATDPAQAQQYMNLAANISDGAGLGSTVTAGSNAVGAGVGGAAVPGASSVVTGSLGGVGGMSAAPGASLAAGLGEAGAIAGGMSTAATPVAITGAAGAGAGAMAAVGAALPWVGAAAAVGSLLGIFKDGGRVGDYDNGGKVPGQWQGNTDTVPALLTEDEHVINAEAAKLIGHDKLEKLNKRGLQQRKKGKTPASIQTIGSGAVT